MLYQSGITAPLKPVQPLLDQLEPKPFGITQLCLLTFPAPRFRPVPQFMNGKFMKVRRLALDSDQTVFVSIPSFVGGNLGSLETGTQFAFGLVTPNSFSQSVNLTTTVPVTTGGTGRLVINSQSSSETLRPVIGFGQRINQEWSVGFRLDGVYSTLSTLRTADWRFVNDDGSLNTIVNEIENYDATVYAVSAAASVLWTPNEKWSIGFMAVAPTYVAQNDGDVNVTFFREDPNSVINAFLNTSSVEANLEDPGSVHLGVGYTAGLEWSIEAAARLFWPTQRTYS